MNIKKRVKKFVKGMPKLDSFPNNLLGVKLERLAREINHDIQELIDKLNDLNDQ